MMAECDYSSMTHRGFNVSRRATCSGAMTSPEVGGVSRRYNSCGDVIDADEFNMDVELAGGAYGRNGQWVTLSKALLLQLVERICQLSFQPDGVYNSSAGGKPSRCRTNFDEAEQATTPRQMPSTATAADRCATASLASKPETTRSSADEKRREIKTDVESDDGQPEVEVRAERTPEMTTIATRAESDAASDDHGALIADEIRSDEGLALSSSLVVATPNSADNKAADCPGSGPSSSFGHQEATAASSIDNNSSLVAAGCKRLKAQRLTTSSGSDEDELTEDDGRPVDCKASKMAPSTSAAVQRARRRTLLSHQRVGRRSRKSRRLRPRVERSEAVSSTQSWMAVNKDIVLCAVDKELSNNNNNVDGEKSSVARESDAGLRAAETTRSSTTIWNPATSLSRFEISTTRWNHNLQHLTGGIWRTHDPTPSASSRWPQADGSAPSAAAAATKRPADNNSSILSALLGFDDAPASPATNSSSTPQTAGQPPRQAADGPSKERRRSDGRDALTAQHRSLSEVAAKQRLANDQQHFWFSCTSSDAVSTTFGLSESERNDVAADGWRHLGPPPSSLNNSTAANAADNSTRAFAALWRPTEPEARLQVETRRQMAVARKRPSPRWVVVSKGDVCLLVDSLVTTMISSESGVGGESRQTSDEGALIQQHSPDGSSSSGELPSPSAEPRKWKSDLLQRVRKEKQ